MEGRVEGRDKRELRVEALVCFLEDIIMREWWLHPGLIGDL